MAEKLGEGRWWQKYVKCESDDIADNIIANSDTFVFSEHIVKLAKDFKAMKNRFLNMCVWQDAGEAYDALPEEEKWRRKQDAKQAEEEHRKIWDNLDE